MTRRALPQAALFLALAAVWMAPVGSHPTGFPFLRGAEFSDLIVAHAPAAELLRTGLQRDGEVPTWNPSTMGGIPFAADPLSGLWYPPFWLTLVLPLGVAYNLIFLLHLALAGWGMARWLRRLGLSEAGSVVGGIAFSGAPKLAAHIGLGHLGWVCAVSWTPWFLLSLRQALDRAAWSGHFPAVTAARGAAVLAASFVADPRWLPPLLLAGALATLDGLRELRSGHRSVPAKWLGAALPRLLLGLALAIGLPAALWLPLEEYLRLSTRAALQASETGFLSLPAGNLAQLLIPAAPVSGEWLTYAGIAVLVLAIAGALAGGRGRLLGVALAAVGAVVALGDATPAAELIGGVWPGMSLLRVPARMLALSSLGLALLAGAGIDGLLWSAVEEARRKTLVRVLFAFSVLVVAFQAALALRGTGFDRPWLAAAAGIAAVGFVLAALSLRRRSAALLPWIWAGLLMADLGAYHLHILEVRPPAAALHAPSVAGQLLEVRIVHQPARIYSPSLSIPAWYAASQGLRLAGGVHPMPLQDYWQRMAEAAGFRGDAYSVTLPPLPDGDPERGQEANLSSVELGRLNIGWVVAGYPIRADGWDLDRVVEGLFVYRNRNVLPWSWVQSSPAWGSEVLGPAEVVQASANRLRVRASGPGTLVLAETAYPGWSARVDGEAREVFAVGGVLRGVALEPGVHEVEFQFLPPRAVLGVLLSLLSLAGWAWVEVRA